MDELDALWAQLMQEALLKAQNTGRGDVAEYLNLKQTNDALRSTGCRWLFDSFIEFSDEANRRGIRLDVENYNSHRFAVGQATMVGSLIKFNRGLRQLSVEAGWTRSPQDGFIRGGGLACARILHFGMSKKNAELMLFASPERVPQWFLITDNGRKNPLSVNHLQEHFRIFLD